MNEINKKLINIEDVSFTTKNPSESLKDAFTQLSRRHCVTLRGMEDEISVMTRNTVAIGHCIVDINRCITRLIDSINELSNTVDGWHINQTLTDKQNDTLKNILTDMRDNVYRYHKQT